MEEKKLTDDSELDIAVYARSFEEGDNITVTCDLLKAMGQAVDVFNEQKAEIEELKERCSKSSYKDSWKNKFFKAQEEIERLTKSYNRAWTKVEEEHNEFEYQRKCTEALQKQVDELKEKIMNLKSAMIDRVARKSYDTMLTTPDDVEEIFGDAYESEFNKFLEQTEKDTAKEITSILKGYNYDGEIDELIALIEHRYGLEVE